MAEMARIIRNGDSYAVELPEGFRLEGEEVRISRDGDQIVLEPVGNGHSGDESTELTIRELRAMIEEGLQGDDAPLDMEDIKRRGRERLALGGRR